MRRTSTGFSLVELIVVMAIVGVLVSLLLPAIQQARESAKQAACTANLKQIGLALATYEDCNRIFPKTHRMETVQVGINYDATYYSLWWELRPYMEQENNSGEAQIKTLLCPSRERAGTTKFDYGIGFPYSGYWFEGFYGNGLSNFSHLPLPAGETYMNYSLAYGNRPEKIRDGASNTLMLGHKGLDPEFYNKEIVAPPDAWDAYGSGTPYHQFYDMGWEIQAFKIAVIFPLPVEVIGFDMGKNHIRRYGGAILKDKTGGYYVDAVYWGNDFAGNQPCYVYMTSPHRKSMPMLWADGSVRALAYSKDIRNDVTSTSPSYVFDASDETKFLTYLWTIRDGQPTEFYPGMYGDSGSTATGTLPAGTGTTGTLPGGSGTLPGGSSVLPGGSGTDSTDGPEIGGGTRDR